MSECLVVIHSQVQTYLKETWVPGLRTSIRGCLATVNKGWFNLEESNYEVYQGSKLRKLNELVKFAMQVHVRKSQNSELALHIYIRATGPQE